MHCLTCPSGESHPPCCVRGSWEFSGSSSVSRNKRAVDLLLEALAQQSLDITTKQDLSKALSLEAFPEPTWSSQDAVQESWFALQRSGSAVPGIDCEDRWWFWAGARAEFLIHGRFPSLLPSVHQCPNTAVVHQRRCLSGYLGQELLALLTGSTTWCSWNAVVTLTLPRCCGCLRISHQFFLLFLEAFSNTVPLGSHKRPSAAPQFWSKDDGLPFLGLVCFTKWFPAWVRTLFPPPCPLMRFGEELVLLWGCHILLPFGLLS